MLFRRAARRLVEWLYAVSMEGRRHANQTSVLVPDAIHLFMHVTSISKQANPIDALTSIGSLLTLHLLLVVQLVSIQSAHSASDDASTIHASRSAAQRSAGPFRRATVYGRIATLRTTHILLH